MRPFPKKSAPKLLFPSFNRNLKKKEKQTPLCLLFYFPYLVPSSRNILCIINGRIRRIHLIKADFAFVIKENNYTFIA